MCDAGKCLLDELQPLAVELDRAERRPRDVAAGVRGACDEPHLNRVSRGNAHHDRDSAGGVESSARCGGTISDDDVDGELDELARKPWQLGGITLSKPEFENDRAAVDISQIAQGAAEGVKNRCGAVVGRGQNADSRHMCRLLSSSVHGCQHRSCQQKDEVAPRHLPSPFACYQWPTWVMSPPRSALRREC